MHVLNVPENARHPIKWAQFELLNVNRMNLFQKGSTECTEFKLEKGEFNSAAILVDRTIICGG